MQVFAHDVVSAFVAPPPAPGQRVGAYRVIERLGRGGSAIVYRGVHVATGRPVALKVPRRELSAGGIEAAVKFLAEARLTARAGGDGVIDMLDVGTLPDGRPMIVMELLSGLSVRDLVRFGPVEPNRAARIAGGIARALATVHASGAIHRDVTATNVVVSDGDRVKLIDFGCAEPIGIEPPEACEVVVGTPCYMSPELATGQVCDERSDLYSMGIVLFEMLTGVPPYTGDTARDIMAAHVVSAVPEFDAHTPRYLRRVVRRLLAKDPDRRYQSAAEVLAAL